MYRSGVWMDVVAREERGERREDQRSMRQAYGHGIKCSRHQRLSSLLVHHRHVIEITVSTTNAPHAWPHMPRLAHQACLSFFRGGFPSQAGLPRVRGACCANHYYFSCFLFVSSFTPSTSRFTPGEMPPAQIIVDALICATRAQSVFMIIDAAAHDMRKNIYLRGARKKSADAFSFFFEEPRRACHFRFKDVAAPRVFPASITRHIIIIIHEV